MPQQRVRAQRKRGAIEVAAGYRRGRARRRRLLQCLELRRYTGRTIIERSRLETELRRIRKEHVSFDQEEYLVGVVCMAVPVIGQNGETLAAIAIQAPEARMNIRIARGHLPALRRAAEELAETFQEQA